MKTYKIYIRNFLTHYCWYFVGTIRANSERDAWDEVYEMQNRNPDADTEYKLEVYGE